MSKATELKKRIWYTLGILIVARIGAYIPLPGIDSAAFEAIFQQHSGGVLGMFDMFAGGAISRMTVFALGIMPYISASIIMQLLTSVSPTLEALKKEGESGRRKINQYTRYGTVVLAPGAVATASPTACRTWRLPPAPARSSIPASSSSSPRS